MTNSTNITRNTLQTIFTVLVSLTIVVSGFANNGNPTNNNPETAKGVQFEKEYSFDEVLRRAKAENKPIFLDFYTTWCGPCRWLDQDVFQLEVVGAVFNENFITIKVNAERGEGPALAKKYGVTSFPTLIYLNSNGEVVKEQQGMATATQIMNQANEVMTNNF